MSQNVKIEVRKPVPVTTTFTLTMNLTKEDVLHLRKALGQSRGHDNDELYHTLKALISNEGL